MDIAIVANAFQGIKVAVGILIFDVAINMIKKMPKKAFSIILMSGSFLVMMLINMMSWDFSSISIMLIAAVVSLFYYSIEDYVKKQSKRK